MYIRTSYKSNKMFSTNGVLCTLNTNQFHKRKMTQKSLTVGELGLAGCFVEPVVYSLVCSWVAGLNVMLLQSWSVV